MQRSVFTVQRGLNLDAFSIMPDREGRDGRKPKDQCLREQKALITSGNRRIRPEEVKGAG